MTQENRDQVYIDTLVAALSAVTGRIDARLEKDAPQIILSTADLARDSAETHALHQSWILLRSGIIHLKQGSPDGKPGTMATAISKSSLRSCAVASSVGVRPPVFEPILLPADFSNGHDAALFYCRYLADAVRQDIPKSRKIISQKILSHKDMPEDIRRQTAFTLDLLADRYDGLCSGLDDFLSGL